jgi:predicted nucleotidyltransferase
MFVVEERDLVRQRLLDLAEGDAGVVAAAVTGSYAAGAADDWSDIDLAFAISGELQPALEHWTEILYRDFAALHHWDLPFGSTVYRVFLLPACLEVDIAFTPAAEFGPRGPNWRTVFGQTVEVAPGPPSRRDDLVGLAWHHVLHARVCIERAKPWQAEYWISGVRDQVLALACMRLGHTTSYAKGAHLLPPEVTAPLEATLVRSLDEAELRRALAAAGSALTAELERTEPALSALLSPMLEELTVPGAPPDSRVEELPRARSR